MRIQSSIAATVLLALAACGSPGSEGNGTAAKSDGGGGAVALQPGEWEMKMEVVSVNAPGLPPAVAAQMKQPATVNRDCMTEEEAKGPKGDMFTGGQANNCKQEGFTWSGGRIHGVTTCTEPGGTGKTSMTMDGEYTAQSMDINMKTDTEARGVKMATEMRITGRRLGECPAGKAG